MALFKIAVLPLFIFALLVAGQARGQGSTTTSRYIDRRVSPGAGRSELTLASGYFVHEYLESLGGSTWKEWYLDGEYRYGLDDSYAVIWSPLPIGIVYRLMSHDPDIEASVSWRLDLIDYNRIGIGPRFNSYFRRKFRDVWAIESLLEYSTFTPFGRDPSVWSTSLTLSFPYQAGDWLAIVPTVAFSLYDNVLKKVFVDDLEESKRGEAQEKIRFVIPVGLAADYRPNDGDKLSLSYTYYGASIDREFNTHLIKLSFTRAW